MKKLIGGVSSAMLVLSAFALPALAAPAFSGTGYSLFDSAHYVSPGEASNRAVQLVSNATSTDGGIDYGFTGSATLADINHLSTDYLFEAGSCGGGSPRFQVNVDTGSGVKNVFVYIGPGPSYTGCPMSAWTNSGELVGTGTVDTSQLPGGTFYDTWAHAESAYGAYPVTGIQLVADGGWAMPTTGQIVDIDNTVINIDHVRLRGTGPDVLESMQERRLAELCRCERPRIQESGRLRELCRNRRQESCGGAVIASLSVERAGSPEEQKNRTMIRAVLVSVKMLFPIHAAFPRGRRSLCRRPFLFDEEEQRASGRELRVL